MTRTLSGDGIRWSLNEGEIAALIAKTDGYSGADMALMIKASIGALWLDSLTLVPFTLV